MHAGRASDTQQIGIFGGSFNPPHIAHLVVAELVREQFALDTILWIPNRQSPFKNREELAPAADRLEMTRLATAGNEAFDLSEVEVQREGVSYTIDTIRTLQANKPEADYHLIIGSDTLAGFSEWRGPEEILRRARIIVFRRSGFLNAEAPEGHESRVDFADAPLLELSSTAIRQRIREGKTIRYMVTDAVGRYISEKGLYRT